MQTNDMNYSSGSTPSKSQTIDMPTPFPADVITENLDIDTSRVFVICAEGTRFQKGQRVLHISHEDKRWGGFFKSEDGAVSDFVHWYKLAYAEEPNLWPKSMLGQMIENEAKAEQPYLPAVGDRVSLEGEITDLKSVIGEEMTYIHIDGGVAGFSFPISKEMLEHATLLSRKSPRRVTKKEVNEKFGEEVIIED